MLTRLSNEKPSAIFRLRGTFSEQSTNTHAIISGASSQGITAVLGIAIGPFPQLMNEVASLPSTVARSNSPVADATILAERIVKHLFNYVAGFAGGTMTPETTVPLGIVARWYETFIAKVRAGGTGFLENQE